MKVKVKVVADGERRENKGAYKRRQRVAVCSCVSLCFGIGEYKVVGKQSAIPERIAYTRIAAR